jgi:hypothetical protein
MKTIIAAFLLVLAGQAPCHAGFRMGLGSAVAKQGGNLFKKAADSQSGALVGDNVAQTLPSCGATPPYNVSPVRVTDIQGIDPLGHVNPSGHTFPSDHIYFYIVPSSGSAPTGPRVVTNVLAPGSVHITNISFAYTNGDPSTTDYGLHFYACRELKSYFGHVSSLSPALLAALGSAKQSCQTYSTGGTTFYRCDADTNLAVSAGDLIGTAGGIRAALDFGAYDYRRTPIAFLSPSRHNFDQPFTVCPIDYFEAGLKATLQPHFGRWDGAVARTALPLCGQILYDVAGTALGDWYHIGSPDSPEDPHLSLIKDNVYDPRQDLSIGASVPGISPLFLPFDPLSSGTHNRNLAQVTSDGNTYCYDTFFDPIGQPASPGYSVLLTMPTATTIRVAAFNAASCGAGPWSISGAYGDFQR